MRHLPRIVVPLVLLATLLVPTSRAQVEILEEIVAWVNGEIITKTEYEAEEEVVVAEAYRQLTGEDLDRYMEDIRKGLLLQMIDRKILVDQARNLYDIDVMGEVFLEQFKEEQGITDDGEFQKMLAAEGMTVDEIKQRLVEMLAPEEVIRFAVTSRVSVSQKEVEAFYEQNRDRFGTVPEVTLSEIVLLTRDDDERDAKRQEAEEARRRVTEGGEEFAAVAQEVSQAGTRDSGGKLGTMKKEDLAAHLAEPAFSLPAGEVSPVIETRYGYHILRIDERTDATHRSLVDVQDEVRGLLQQVKYGDELKAYLDKIRSESDWCVKTKYKNMLKLDDAAECGQL